MARPGPWAATQRPTSAIERTRVLVIPRRRRELERSPVPQPAQVGEPRGARRGILGVQAALSLRMRNTAFEDEALYLSAGHLEMAHWVHGAALQGDYATYFSGAPVLYPVLGAMADSAGGLAAARRSAWPRCWPPRGCCTR